MQHSHFTRAWRTQEYPQAERDLKKDPKYRDLDEHIISFAFNDTMETSEDRGHEDRVDDQDEDGLANCHGFEASRMIDHACAGAVDRGIYDNASRVDH